MPLLLAQSANAYKAPYIHESDISILVLLRTTQA